MLTEQEKISEEIQSTVFLKLKAFDAKCDKNSIIFSRLIAENLFQNLLNILTDK